VPQGSEPDKGDRQDQGNDGFARGLKKTRMHGMVAELIGERGLSKLRWRCRRGLLENDLFIERFFHRFSASLTVKQADAMGALMDLSDNDLLDVQLARKSLGQVDANLDREDVREVLSMLREPL
jgi:antitoxin CptB